MTCRYFYTKDSANFETDFIRKQSKSLNKAHCLIKDKGGFSQLFLIPIHFQTFNRCLQKEVAHIHKGILFNHKENKTMKFVEKKSVELENVILNEVTQDQKYKYWMSSFICRMYPYF